MDFRISACRVDPTGMCIVLGIGQRVAELDPETYLHPSRPSSRTRRQSASPTKTMHARGVSIVASCDLDGIIVTIDSRSVIRATNSASSEGSLRSMEMSAHEDAIQGVQPFKSQELPSACMMTFSASGSICFWNAEGVCSASLTVPLPDAPSPLALANELKSVASHQHGSAIVAGDAVDAAPTTVLEKRGLSKGSGVPGGNVSHPTQPILTLFFLLFLLQVHPQP